MPLYSYDCLDCKLNVDIRHAYGDKNVQCPSCKSENLKKNLSKVLQTVKKCYNIKDQPGTEVHKAIEEGRQEVQSFKEKQKKRIYKKQ